MNEQHHITPDEREQLLGQYLRGVVAWALHRFDRCPLVRRHEDDLRQLATIAVYRATETWRPEAGCGFKSWACNYARTAIHNELKRLRRCREVNVTPDEGERQWEPVAPEPHVPDVDGDRLVYALSRLKPLDAKIVSDYFGLDGKGGRSQPQIAATLGLTHHAISQRLAKSLEHMGMALRQLEHAGLRV